MSCALNDGNYEATFVLDGSFPIFVHLRAYIYFTRCLMIVFGFVKKFLNQSIFFVVILLVTLVHKIVVPGWHSNNVTLNFTS